MSGYTPKPWFQSHREGRDGMFSTEVYDAKGVTIATLAWYAVPQPDGSITTAREDNARLIAAAPDLADVVYRILARPATDLLDAATPWLVDARAALAKVEGK